MLKDKIKMAKQDNQDKSFLFQPSLTKINEAVKSQESDESYNEDKQVLRKQTMIQSRNEIQNLIGAKFDKDKI